MRPVLAVRDPVAARRKLAGDFGWTDDGGLMRLGEQAIIVNAIGQRPENFLATPLDHVALSVADADSAFRTFSARGARLAARYTPSGPRDIPEFWEHGVRFVFFETPDGWPLEFCAVNGRGIGSAAFGHSHYGIRCANVEAAERQFAHHGASRIAGYRLEAGPAIVNVLFLQLGAVILELFDEPPFAEDHGAGWIGLAWPRGRGA
jgi:catechol 2,3-dioxygenase-like lactoylglutathione lyase family enzyme